MIKKLWLISAVALPLLKLAEIGAPARWPWLAVFIPLLLGVGFWLARETALFLFVQHRARKLRRKHPTLCYGESVVKAKQELVREAQIRMMARSMGLG